MACVVLLLLLMSPFSSGQSQPETSSTENQVPGSHNKTPPYWNPSFSPINNFQVSVSSSCCETSDSSSLDHLVNMTETIVKLLQEQNSSPQPQPLLNQPRDCSEIQAGGINESGRYAIYADGAVDPFFVYCDMETDGGGWTVFQRRENGAVDFYLNWCDYKYGFGSVSSEHWLGNDKISHLTSRGNFTLRIDLEDFDGETRHAQYSQFSVGSEATNYQLTVNGFSGDAGDSLSPHSGLLFSTKDSDNDEWRSSCALTFQGAWWYGNCHSSNLNGLYLGGSTTQYATGVAWSSWKGQYYSLKKSEMKMRMTP